MGTGLSLSEGILVPQGRDVSKLSALPSLVLSPGPSDTESGHIVTLTVCLATLTFHRLFRTAAAIPQTYVFKHSREEKNSSEDPAPLSDFAESPPLDRKSKQTDPGTNCPALPSGPPRTSLQVPRLAPGEAPSLTTRSTAELSQDTRILGQLGPAHTETRGQWTDAQLSADTSDS